MSSRFIDVAREQKERYTIDEPGRYLFFVYNYSGTVHIDIAVRDAEVHIVGLCVGRGDEIFTIRTVQRHITGANASQLFLKSVLFDTARLHHEGLVRIEPNAAGASAHQKSKGLMMSQGAFVDSRPYLEIEADEVSCTHASTTGQLNKEQLLYVQNRGLSQEQAEQLLVEGFIDEVFLYIERLGYAQEAKRHREGHKKIMIF